MSATPEQINDQPVLAPRAFPPLWYNLDYVLLLGGQAVSKTGTQVSQFAFPLLVLILTRSPALAGLSGALVATPYLFLSLPAGVLVDRWNRKRIMLLSDVGRAVALGSIPVALLLGHLSLVQLLLCPLIEGICFTFFDLAESACLPQVVSREQLTVASAQNGMAQRAAYMLGPAIGGPLLGWGRSLPFVADFISYTLSILSLLFIRRAFQQPRQEAPRAFLADMREGVQWIWQRPLMRVLAVFGCMANFLENGLLLLLVLLAVQRQAPLWFAGAIGTFALAGGFCGAWLAAPVQKRLRFGPIMVVSYISVAVVLLLLYLFNQNLAALGPLTFLFYLLGAIKGEATYNYRRSLVPDRLQGRVSSVFREIAYAGPPLAYAATGVLLQAFGGSGALIVLVVLAALQAAATIGLPYIRSAPPPVVDGVL